MTLLLVLDRWITAVICDGHMLVRESIDLPDGSNHANIAHDRRILAISTNPTHYQGFLSSVIWVNKSAEVHSKTDCQSGPLNQLNRRVRTVDQEPHESLLSRAEPGYASALLSFD